MSAAELLSTCRACGSLHPVNGPCPVPIPGGRTEAAPVHAWSVDGETACGMPYATGLLGKLGWGGVTCPACLTHRPAPVQDLGAAPVGTLGTVAHWHARATAAEAECERLRRLVDTLTCERDKALAAYGNVSGRLREEAEAHESTFELLTRERNAALAVLRRLREASRELYLVRAGVDDYDESHKDAVAREYHRAFAGADAMLASHDTPAKAPDLERGEVRHPAAGPSIVSDGLPVTCQGCGGTTTTLRDGLCPVCRPPLETYPCGCRGTPGNRCPVHDAP